MTERIAVVGAGAWGSALATIAARAGRGVTLWARDPEAVVTITQTRESPRLPGFCLDDRIIATAALSEVADADVVLLAVPSQQMRSVAASLVDVVREGAAVVACAKGIERGTHRFMTEVIAEALPGATPAILSGPGFAEEVARGLPTAVTLGCADERSAVALAHALGSPTFRP